MIIKLIALVLPLGLDTLVVAELDARQRLRVSALMTSFEAGMPLVGLALGVPLGNAIGSGA
jgi:hypothetical protein